MSINCYQNKLKFVFSVIVFLLLLSPAPTRAMIPIDFDGLETELSESSTKVDNKLIVVEKKKDKVQMNQYFFLSLLINLTAVFLIIHFVYYPNYKKMDTIFTFLLFNIVIFLLTYVLNEVKMSMGAAFGLFAVFSMLRYRTAGIGMKDMTYLFIFIALGLVSAIQLEFYKLGIMAAIIFVATIVLDTKLIMKKEFSNILRYERIEMITPDKREELIEELKERTGLDIHRVTINEIDFLKDTAMISYYYYS